MSDVRPWVFGDRIKRGLTPFLQDIRRDFRLYPPREALLRTVVEGLVRPRWVVSEGRVGELGLRIFGVNLWYYKWPDPMLDPDRKWRFAGKREFGEVIRSTSGVTRPGA